MRYYFKGIWLTEFMENFVSVSYRDWDNLEILEK